MADQADITETVRQIVENAQFLDTAALEKIPELRVAKKLQFTEAEFIAMQEALRTEKVLSVAELHRIIAETKRKEDEAAKEAELDGSLLTVGGIYLFDQDAPLDLSAHRVENYEPLSEDEPESGLRIDEGLESGRTSRASLRSAAITTGDDTRAPTPAPIGDLAGNAVQLEDELEHSNLDPLDYDNVSENDSESVLDDEGGLSDGELDEAEPGEAEEVDSVHPGAELDRKVFLAWSFTNGRPLEPFAHPSGPGISPGNRVSLLEFLKPIWTTKGSNALIQLRTPDGRAEVNSHIRGRQVYLPELDKFVTASHMAKQAGDTYLIHVPHSPPYTLRQTNLAQLYVDRHIPLEFPKLMLVNTDSGMFPLERLFLVKNTPLDMLSAIPTARKPRGPPTVPRFNPAVPPPTITSGTGPLVRTRIFPAPTGRFENTKFESQWSTVVARRAKPRTPPSAPVPSTSDAPSTSASVQRPPPRRIVYVQPAGKRSLPHDHVQCEQCGYVLKLARH